MTWRLLISALAGLSLLAAAGAGSAADEEKPYVVKDGKVDAHTYNGWRRYTESCLRCHGPDGAGSSYAPDLTESLKSMSEDQFKEVVVNGRKNVNTASENVMPSFGTNPNVSCYMDDIFIYVRARANEAIGRGRPAKHEEKSDAAAKAEASCMGQ